MKFCKPEIQFGVWETNLPGVYLGMATATGNDCGICFTYTDVLDLRPKTYDENGVEIGGIFDVIGDIAKGVLYAATFIVGSPIWGFSNLFLVAVADKTKILKFAGDVALIVGGFYVDILNSIVFQLICGAVGVAFAQPAVGPACAWGTAVLSLTLGLYKQDWERVANAVKKMIDALISLGFSMLDPEAIDKMGNAMVEVIFKTVGLTPEQVMTALPNIEGAFVKAGLPAKAAENITAKLHERVQYLRADALEGTKVELYKLSDKVTMDIRRVPNAGKRLSPSEMALMDPKRQRAAITLVGAQNISQLARAGNFRGMLESIGSVSGQMTADEEVRTFADMFPYDVAHYIILTLDKGWPIPGPATARAKAVFKLRVAERVRDLAAIARNANSDPEAYWKLEVARLQACRAGNQAACAQRIYGVPRTRVSGFEVGCGCGGTTPSIASRSKAVVGCGC